MLKIAKSTDPVQQALRDRKRTWNNAAKIFIKKLIAFKKGLNGHSDPGFGIPDSKIQNPFPSEIINFLHEVSDNFEQLAGEALRITQKQADYSKNRKKPNPEVRPEGMPSPPAIASNQDIALVKLANQFEQKWKNHG